MYAPKHRMESSPHRQEPSSHRLFTKPDAALESGLERVTSTARLGRRSLLGAVAVVGVTGSAASAATFVPTRKPIWHNIGRPLIHPHRPPHGTTTSDPTTHPTGGPTSGPTTDPTTDPTMDPTIHPTDPPTDPPSTPPTPPPSNPPSTDMRLIGMSAPPAVWSQRVRDVGPGLRARRIFADLASGAGSQLALVEQAHAEGMLPVISYKVGGDIAGAVEGGYNAVAAEAAARLASYGKPTAVTFWHEPHNDMTTDQYVAASLQVLPAFKRGELRVGPLLNGFLLDRQVDVFDAYCPQELMRLWDWVGIDTYQLGSPDSPGKTNPAARIYALSDYVRARGYNHPLGVGEYNGFTTEAISAAGEALLLTPNIWFGCVWNSNGGRDYVLSGDRLRAFQQTLSDPRSARPTAV